MEKYKVSIIIVSFNTLELTKQCLKSVYEQTKDISFEVIVIDNGSLDGSVEMIKQQFPYVILIQNNDNLGFGKANNIGLTKAKGEYIFYLNSDTILLNNAVKIFYDYWKNNSGICALGCILQDNNGGIIHSGANFPTYKDLCKYYSRRLFINYAKSLAKFVGIAKKLKTIKQKKGRKPDFIRAGEIDYVTGADLFLKNDENAYFDEGFFLYYEETDLQLRLKKATGKKCILLDEPKIVHLTCKDNPEIVIESKSQIFNQVSAIKYAKKHLKKNPLFLKIVFRLNMMNPYIAKQKKSIVKDLLKF